MSHIHRLLPLSALALVALYGCAGDNGDGVETDTQSQTCVELGGTDADGDGVCAPEDCDDNNKLVYPGADDIPYNGRDEDCDGFDLNDWDGDGYVGEQAGGDDCNDSNPEVYPGAEEECYADLDYNCDGVWGGDDCDRDGYPKTTDCDDQDDQIYPGAPDDWYDGLDSDCARNSDFDVDGDGDEIEWQAGWPDAAWGTHPHRAGKIFVYDPNNDGKPNYVDVLTASQWRGLDCDDEEPLVGGGLPELWDGIDRNCDGVIDLIRDRDAWLSWTGHAGVNDDALGTAVRFLKDIDGDGLPEVAVSDLAATEYTGRVYVLPGSAPSGRALDFAIATIDGIAGVDAFVGWALEAADLNGDGKDELIVGAPLWENTGATLIFDGSDLSGGALLDTSNALTILTGEINAGIDTAVTGDLDDDGVPDVITALGGGYGPLWAGVYSGAAAGQGTDDLIALISDDGYYSGRIAASHDLTGDGRADLLISSVADAATTATGSLWLMDDVGDIAFPDVADYPELTEDLFFGNWVGILEDIDGDGYNEAVVANPNQTSSLGGEAGGVVYVVDGDQFGDGAVSSAAMFTVQGSAAGGFMSVDKTFGDFDGDGSPDLLVGVPGQLDVYSATSGGAPVSGPGDVYWYRSATVAAGGTVGPEDADANLSSFADGSMQGISWSAGDIDADGHLDLLVGAPNQGVGQAHLYRSLFE